MTLANGNVSVAGPPHDALPAPRGVRCQGRRSVYVGEDLGCVGGGVWDGRDMVSFFGCRDHNGLSNGTWQVTSSSICNSQIYFIGWQGRHSKRTFFLLIRLMVRSNLVKELPDLTVCVVVPRKALISIREGGGIICFAMRGCPHIVYYKFWVQEHPLPP